MRSLNDLAELPASKRRAAVEPGNAAPEIAHAQLAPFGLMPVDVGDLQFATR